MRLRRASSIRKAVQSRHHLVQEDKIETPFLDQTDGILAVGNRGDLVAPFLEKHYLGLQQIDLIVHPENRSLAFGHQAPPPACFTAGISITNSEPLPGDVRSKLSLP